MGLQQGDPWQVPEAWAGSLDTARILFLSSNPSISEDDESGDLGEDYPLSSWPDDKIANFMMRRFDPDAGFVRDDRFRRKSGEYSKRPVRFWLLIRRRAEELLGQADPNRDFVMTEVVHCKSRSEVGVAEATETCSELYLNRLLKLCPANVVTIVGAKARDRVRAMWSLPEEFGRKDSVGVDEKANLAVRTIGSRQRLVVYLRHPNSRTGLKDFRRNYPTHFEAICRVAKGTDDPAAIVSG